MKTQIGAMTMTTSNPSPLPDPIGEIQHAWEKATPGEWWRSGRINEVKERVYDLWAGTLPLGTLWGDNAVWLPEGQGEGQNADFAIAAHNHWPAVAAHISTLAATVERLEAERNAMEKRLAERYLRGGPNEQATIAELCDECLDRSGAMLGRIRAAALAARTGGAGT